MSPISLIISDVDATLITPDHVMTERAMKASCLFTVASSRPPRGIAPKIIKKLTDGTFMRAFTDKGRFSDFLSAIPVQVVLNEDAALLGAAYYAAFRSE